MTTLNTSLDINKTFQYLTKNDFISAFGRDRTVLVIKDYKKLTFNFNTVNESLLLRNQKNAQVRDIEILGDVIRPTQVKLVNLQPKLDTDSTLLFCLDKMAVNDEETDEKKSADPKKRKTCAIGKLLNINLFRRQLKAKTFLELEQSEREKLATVLDHDRFKDKSMFHYISQKQLVKQSDYEEPDFIPLSPPSDTDYEQNYSLNPPDVHDLFDLEVNDSDYMIVEEFLDEEEEV